MPPSAAERHKLHRVRATGRELGHHESVRRVRETALCAFVAALVVAPGVAAEVAAAPCVGAGIVAIIPPGASGATTLGPAVEASTTTGDSAPTFHDAQYAVDLSRPRRAAAGCVRGTAPGGTHAMTRALERARRRVGRLAPRRSRPGGWRRVRLAPPDHDHLAPRRGAPGGCGRRRDRGNRQLGDADGRRPGRPSATAAASLLVGRARVEADARARRPACGDARVDRLRRGESGAGEAAASTPDDDRPVTKTPPATTTAFLPPTTTARTTTASTTTTAKPKPKKKHATKKKAVQRRPHKPAKGMPLTGTPPLGGAYTLPGRRARRLGRHRTEASGRTSPAAGTTATICSRRSGRLSSQLPTERSSRSAGTASAGGGYGSSITSATTSTTRISPDTRGSRATTAQSTAAM